LKRVISLFQFIVILTLSLSFVGWIDPSYDKTKEGNALYKEGKYDEAISKYIDARLEKPDSPALDFNIADAQYKNEKFDEAKGAFETVIKKTKDIELKSKANFNIGNTLYRQGKLEEALDSYKHAIELTDELVDTDKMNKEIEDLRENSKYNHEFVEKKIEEMKKEQKERQEEEKKEEEEKKKEQEKKEQEQQQGQGDDKEDEQEKRDDNQQPEDDKGGKKNKEQKENEQKKPNQEDKKEEEKDENQNQQKPEEGKEDQAKEDQAKKEQGQMKNQPDNKMTKEEAERLLEALQQSEKNNKIKIKPEPGRSMIEKDW